MRRIGVHVSISGGIELSLERAKNLGINTMQIFSHNPRQWYVKPINKSSIELFKRERRNLDITPLYIHTSYLINIASTNRVVLEKSKKLLLKELDIADSIGADYLVLHPGSASSDEIHRARKRAVDSLNMVLSKKTWKCTLLLENTAGERGDISSYIYELFEIIEGVTYRGIGGVCIDTCHAFSAGYNLRSEEGVEGLLREIKEYLGVSAVKLLHVNDSKGDVGSHIDRHEHIGKGKIGIDGFKLFLRRSEIANVPLILETPKDNIYDDKVNLDKVRKIVANWYDGGKDLI
ncbi:MAG: deoxyribonuclease IV [Nitrospirae bacterium]|nr:MAG: deoxyribonuclease IV [Nitrospirota bacterium]